MNTQNAPRIGFYSLEISNTFNETLLRGVRDGCKELGFTLTVLHGGQIDGPHNHESVRNHLYTLFQQLDLDGILLSSIMNFCPDECKTSFLTPLEGRPIVTLGYSITGASSIVVNNTMGFKDLLEDLIVEKGCKKLGVITGPRGSEDTVERLTALLDSLRRNSLEFDAQYLYEGTYSHTSGRLGVEDLFDKKGLKLDALICFNDNMALGAHGALQERGIRIPEDLLLTGFDNTEESRALMPPLSTVHFPMYEMGKTGVHQLAKKIQTPGDQSNRTLPTRFIPRASSAHQTLNISDKTPLGDPRFESLQSVNESSYDEDFLPRGQLLDSLMELYISRVRSPLGPAHIATTRAFLKQLIWLIFKALQQESLGPSISLLSSHLSMTSRLEWDTKPWPEILLLLGRVCYKLLPKAHSSFLIRLFSEILHTAEEGARNQQLSQKVLERKMIEGLHELGERIGTSHHMGRIQQVLAEGLHELGINYCRIFLIDKTASTPRPQKIFELGEGGDDPTMGPSECFVDLLHLQDNILGYILYDIPKRPGLIFKTLRHQISSSIHTSFLMERINQYAGNLEVMIADRTHELEEEVRQKDLISAELLKQRNLESIGLLAGGLAHDFNNLLTGILGNVSLLQLPDLTTEEQKRCLEDVEKACGRAKGLTHQLVIFSQGGSPVKSRVNVVQLLNETSQFTMSGSSVKVSQDIPPDLWDADADKNQICQVFQNIMINALQSMPLGGNLQIIARNSSVNQSIVPLKPGEYIGISIIDNGIGIPAETMDKIFDPYFSTKATGTGLGLPTSQAILKKHGGHIQIESQPGSGTLVRIWIPRSKEKILMPNIPSSANSPTGLKILVLEDQDILSALVKKMLNRLGHIAIVTTEGHETITEWSLAIKNQEPFDLLLLDLTVPGGWGGLEVISELLNRGQEPLAVACSGYAEGSAMANPSQHGFTAVLKKPYGIKELEQLLFDLFHNRP